MTISGIRYGAIEAQLDRQQGDNVWLTMGLREGKNREIRKVLEALGLKVSRLIRVAYGPFQLGRLEPGEIEEVPGKVLADQLGRGDPGHGAIRRGETRGAQRRPCDGAAALRRGRVGGRQRVAQTVVETFRGRTPARCARCRVRSKGLCPRRSCSAANRRADAVRRDAFTRRGARGSAPRQTVVSRATRRPARAPNKPRPNADRRRKT